MNHLPLIHLNVSELVVAEEPVEISTVLGSCVAVCLWCPEKKMGGMIHFALPIGEDMSSGSASIPLLIEELCTRSGSPCSALQAKIVGGAAVVEGLTQTSDIGEMNVSIAREILQKHGIKIVGVDVGGTVGRRVCFFPATGRLRVAAAISATVLPIRKKVLIVDDSKTMRMFLRKVFSRDPGLEVVGEVADAREADLLLPRLKPDVMTLDVHMPGMDGVAFLEKLMPRRPLPVVMITALNLEESGLVLRAIELGAVDYIQKPRQDELHSLGPLICERVRVAASAHIKIRRTNQVWTGSGSAGNMNHSTIVAIGASTGGTEALKEVLLRLPKDIPPIVIVQHIPAGFSLTFANRLNELCPFEVKEACDGDQVLPGRVLIAPGGRQMALAPGVHGYLVRITEAVASERHNPSVDRLFDSVAEHVRKKAIGVILTGMGSDGSKGLLKMKQAGARTIGQDEASSVVYGMPKVAFQKGAVEEVLALEKISGVLVKWLCEKKAA